MSTTFEKDIISIVKASLLDTVPDLSKEFDPKEAYALAVKHQIVPLIYYGLAKTDKLGVTNSRFLMSTASLTQYSSLQLSEAQVFFERLDKAKIPYLKMKGTILKKLYRYPEMRMMSDIDVYVKMDRYEEIKAILTDLGFTYKTESNHEVIWEKGKIVFELHKRLIPSYTKDLFSYFGDDPWERLIRVDENHYEYKMTENDTYIYLFTHFAKHYRDGGIGIKFLTDFYVYEKSNALDYSYIEGELDKIGMLQFYKNTKKVLDTWFFDKESDDVTDFITAKIFASSTYGERKAKLEAEALRLAQANENVKAGKRKRKLQMIFPPYQQMCGKYPFLKGWAILLPLMWVVRIISALIKKKGSSAIASMNDLDSITKEQIERYDAELHYVGIPYNF